MQSSPTPYSKDPSWKTHGVSRQATEPEVDKEVLFWKGWLKAHPELLQ